MTILIQNTAAGFTSDNPVLTIHQVGQETDTKLTKQGDGSTAWNDLDYDTPTKEAFEQILSGLRNKVPSSYAVQQAIAGGGGGTNSNVLIDCGTFLAPSENVLIECGVF